MRRNSCTVIVLPGPVPAEQAVGVLQALGSLGYGPWWPNLDDLINTAGTFYPGHLTDPTPGHPGHLTDPTPGP